MRPIHLAPLVALVAACTTLAPLPSGYRAIGTEPFWDLRFGESLVFTDRGNDLSVSEPAPRAEPSATGRTYRGRRLLVTITHAPCSDGMSDRTYPDSVTLSVDGRIYRGCGAPAAFFARTAP